jgi:hypothetical protein
MGSDRWQRTKQILEEALRFAPDKRQAYLDAPSGIAKFSMILLAHNGS